MAHHTRFTLLFLLLISAIALAAPKLPMTAPDPALATLQTHPSITLGHRAQRLRSVRPIDRTLVLVADARGALDEIAQWKPGLLWPVLIDDGSERASADIARFVRAFQPDRILIAPTSDERGLTQEDLEGALASSWGAASIDTLTDAFVRSKWTPPGVVITDADHPSAIAALALAAGRGQPIIWTDHALRSGNGVLPGAMRDDLLRDLGAGLRALPYEWDAIADDIDAVTICLETDGRVRARDNKTVVALTDRVGRDPDDSRWAYAGWIRGDAPSSLYDAMCALMLSEPGPVWIYDGYPQGFVDQYACALAEPLMQRAGLVGTIVTPPNTLPDAWRLRTRRPLNAGVIHVNSLGDPRRFQLGAKKHWGYASDVPTLERPAIVHFIHSFSAQTPANDETIASRWLDEGAYAYLGSVDEPLLGAFQPPDMFMTRLLGGGAFGAIVRRDGLGAWRTQVFGDPLVSISRTPPPAPTTPRPFPGYRTLESELMLAATDRDLSRVIRTMIMLNREQKATRVLMKALEQQQDVEAPRVDPDAALYATVIAHRTGDAQLMVLAAQRLSAQTWDDARHRDRLWRTLRPSLEDGSADSATLSLLRAALRPPSAAEDGALLAPAFDRLFGRETTDALLRNLRAMAFFDEDQDRLDTMLGR